MFDSCLLLKSIVIPNSVTSIDTSAFERCTSLTSVSLSTSLKRIGWNTFNGCDSLQRLEIPSSCDYIGINSVKGCTSLTHVKYPVNKFGYFNCNISSDEYKILKPFIKTFLRIEWNHPLTKNDEPSINEECNWVSSKCYQNNNNYDYNEEKDALIGRREFKIKQIQVFQMKENEEMKQQKKMIIYKTENKNWNLKSKKRKNNGIK